MAISSDHSKASELFETALSFREAALILTAVDLDIFERAEGGTAIEDLAGNDLNNKACERLCLALVSRGYLNREAEIYSCPPKVSDVLHEEAENSLKPMIGHLSDVYEMWGDLPDVIRGGQKSYDFMGDELETYDRDFLKAMEARAQFDKQEVVDHLAERLGDGHLLDLGGGSGVYSRAILEVRDDARATLADLEKVLDHAEDFLKDEFTRDRMNTFAVDLLRDESYGKNYDMALLSAVLHLFDPDDCQQILSRTSDALKDGGEIVIRDYLMKDDRAGPDDGALFDLMMLLATDGGRTYTIAELKNFLNNAGFMEPIRLELDGVSDDLLIAKKPQ